MIHIKRKVLKTNAIRNSLKLPQSANAPATFASVNRRVNHFQGGGPVLAYIIFPSLLGLGLAMDYYAQQTEDEEDDPILIDLAEGVTNFEGTDAKEHVEGNALDNMLNGADGNDLLGGADGDDTLMGGDGDDRLFGSPGDDIGLGGEGNDKIFLGDGDDTTVAENGEAQDAGDDFIRGGAGADTIIDGKGSNQIFGDLGADRIITVDGLQADGSLNDTEETNTPDTVHAGYGNDTIIGDDGDVLTGGGGDDTFVILTTLQSPGAPAVLTDFDLRDDLFSIIFMDPIPEDQTVEFTYNAETGLLHASVGDHDIATLSGLTAADVPFIQTYITTLPEMMAQAA